MLTQVERYGSYTGPYCPPGKYRLINAVDGDAERRKTIKSILDFVKKHATDISKRFSENASYKPSEKKSAIPQLRLQLSQSCLLLCESTTNKKTKFSRRNSSGIHVFNMVSRTINLKIKKNDERLFK
jgi:hypothetical protein